MSDTTDIEWCDRTWSPWEGCQKVSPACDFCYAEARNNRFAGGRNWGPGAPRRKTVDWTKPRLWNRNAARDGVRISVFPSICDPFDNAVPDEWREEFFELIRVTPNLEWLLLTKRPQNIIRMVRRSGAIAGNGTLYLPDNVRLGTTAEDQQRAELNLPPLIATQRELGARRLFVSIEPMLGPVNLHPWLCAYGGVERPEQRMSHFCEPNNRLSWVITGGESGPQARPSNPQWFRDIRDQCAAAGVRYLHKQNGEFASVSEVAGPGVHHTFDDGRTVRRVGKKLAGRLLDGVQHDGYPEALA